MRILHLLSQRPDSTGSGFYLQNILRQAENRGHENFLVAGHSFDLQTDIPRLEGVASKRCRFVSFGSPPLDFTIPGMSDVMPYPSRRFQDLSTAQIERYCAVFSETVRSIADRFQPDIVHSHHLWLMSAAARHILPELPMVTSCHSTDLRQLVLCPLLRDRVVDGCRGIDRILALSKIQAEQISVEHCRSGETIDLIGAGFDDTLFNYDAEKRHSPLQGAEVELLYGGKLSYAKGVDLLLESFSRISASDSKLHLHLAGSGSGPEAEHCLQLAKALGDAVTVHGRISQHQLAGLMQRCHIFVLPSFYEGLPLVLLEALACCSRLVVTDLPGSRELLAKADDKLALRIPLPAMKSIDQPEPAEHPKMVEGLAAALTRMIRNCRVSSSPRPSQIKAITEPYKWPTIFSRIEQAYQKAVKEHPVL